MNKNILLIQSKITFPNNGTILKLKNYKFNFFIPVLKL